MGDSTEALEARIAALREAGRYRVPDRGGAQLGRASSDTNADGAEQARGRAESDRRDPASAVRLDCTSNDYLGFRSRPVSRETWSEVRRLPLGAGSARAIGGSHSEHRLLEAGLAEWVGLESALALSSGTAANQAALVGLCQRNDRIYSDELNHASLIDGCRLAGAEVSVYPHRDLRHLERLLEGAPGSLGERWVVSETYFSMDGTSPDLLALAEVCRRHGARLVLDESHALGVFGPRGAGLAAREGVRADVVTGGFGKALSAQGGFVACSAVARALIWNLGRAHFYSTGLSPLLARLVRERLSQAQGADRERARLFRHSLQLQQAVTSLGLRTPEGRHGPIFPLVLGDERAVLEAAARLGRSGVLVQPIRPPTVPPGACRLRITLHAGLTAQEMDGLVRGLEVLVGQPQAGAGDSGGRGGANRADGPGSTHSERDGEAAGEGGRRSVAVRERGAQWDLETDASPGWAAAIVGHAGRVRPNSVRAPDVLGLRGAGGERLVADRGGSRATRDGTGSAPVRAVLLGTGTGVGKTFVTAQLARHLQERGTPVAALKPIETGVPPGGPAADARLLEASSFHVKHPRPHPLYVGEAALTPALVFPEPSAISLPRIVAWARPLDGGIPPVQLIETAGGCYSPLASDCSNLDLAQALAPALWVLVAPNRLGVLHDLAATLTAMAATHRLPDWIVLSQPETPDESSASNRRLALLGPASSLGASRVLQLAGPGSLEPLAEALIRMRASLELDSPGSPFPG